MAFFCFTAQSLFFIKPQLAHLLTPFSVFQLQAPQRGQIGILTVVGKVVFRIVFNKRQGATDDDPRRPLALPPPSSSSLNLLNRLCRLRKSKYLISTSPS